MISKSRLVHYTNRWIESRLSGVFDSTLRHQREQIRPIMINSVPKAGTHLVESAVRSFGLLRHSGNKTLNVNVGIRVFGQKLDALRCGDYQLGHIEHSKEIEEVISSKAIHCIFVVRDPRDVIVSKANYLKNIDRSHKFAKHFTDLTHDEAVELSIRGIDGVMPSMKQSISLFEPWMTVPDVLVIRYEDVIGERGGEAQSNQAESLSKIRAFMQAAVTGDLDIPNPKSEQVFDTKSLTFGSGESRKWKKRMNESNLSLFYDMCGDNWFGYTREDSPDSINIV